MDFGIVIFNTDSSIRPDDLARAAEDRQFESLWFPEHTHIPCSRRSPWPGGPDLPPEYLRTHDLFVALATAAAVTRSIKIGTGICLVVEHDPITLAKAVASLDVLSNGRLLFGVGGGWNAEEMQHHGTNFNRRWHVLRERIEAMKVIWAEDRAEYHGTYVDFEPIWSWPKPRQIPHPPIYLGGHGPQVLQRVVDYCDGWMPIPARAGDLSREIADLRARETRAGRRSASVSITAYAAPPDPAILRSFAEAGICRAILSLPSAPRDTVLPILDRYADLMRMFNAG